MKLVNPSTLSPRVNARLASYATLAGAALAAPALAPDAGAAIIYSGPINLNIPTTTSGIYLNLVTGVSNTAPASAPGWDFNPWGTGSLFLYGAGTGNGALDNLAGGSSATLIDNLPLGTSISGTSAYGNFAAETTGATLFNLNSSANYVGIRFTNEATGATNYGWAQLSISASYISQPRTIVGYAYDDTGAAIAAGAVPEPTTNAALGLGALALGAMGVRRWRKAKAA